MSRNLKALGLALVASLALCGIVAAAAQASTGIKSEIAGETTIDVSNDQNVHGELARLTIGNGARFVECTELKLTDHIFTGTTLSITGTVDFNKCVSNNLTTAPATVTHNGCNFTFTATAGNTADVTVGGEKCTQIELHVFENEAAEKENKPICTYDIPPQTVKGAVLKNAGGAANAMDITAELKNSEKVKNITNTGPGGLAVCGIASGGKGEGSFDKNLTITGTAVAGGGPAGITLI